MRLNGYELEVDELRRREEVINYLRVHDEYALLVLNTCQRLECYGFGEPSFEALRVRRTWKADEAFIRLTRIAAGLESRIIGELEVLGQVREAYRQFQAGYGEKAKELDRVFQRSLALARKARRESGIDRTQTSLSAMAVRELLQHVSPDQPIAVVGSGSLASGVARRLNSRTAHPIRIAGRCPENALRLANSINGFADGIDRLAYLLDGVTGIISATAAPHPVIYASHLSSTSRPLTIVDLGVPPDCHPDVQTLPGVRYISLTDVENHAKEKVEERRRRGDVAARIIEEGAREWTADL